MMDTGIAVVVPTMNRPEFLRRTAQWYSRHGVSLYIGDSSPAKCDLTRVATLLTHHYHTPGLNELEASLMVALKSNAPYLAWSGDDDFLLPVALRDAEFILEQNPKVTSVYGESVILATVNNAVFGAPESSVRYTNNDAFFRVYRREVLIEGLRQAVYGESYDARGRALERDLMTRDKERRYIPNLMLIRQVHPWRVTADKIEPWRSRLGHAFPKIQYLKQWVESWCWHQTRGQCDNCRLMLPSLLNSRSPFHDDFLEIVRFLSK